MWKRGLWLAGILMMAAEGGGEGGGGAPAGGGQAGEGGDPGAGAAAATGGSGEPSLLAGGAGGPTDFIPEKYRVLNGEGALDLDASARRLAEAHGELETRLGSGGARPKTAEEYTVTVPDTLKEAFDPKTDAGMQAFLKSAHEKGMTQGQLDFVMENYFRMAPELAGGAARADAAAAREVLSKVWATPEAMEQGPKDAYVAASVIAKKAGVDIGDVMNGPLGNDPNFLRMMASMAGEFREDDGIGAGAKVSAEDVQTLMRSEAYNNSKHPDHEKVSAQIRRHYERTVGNQPVR